MYVFIMVKIIFCDSNLIYFIVVQNSNNVLLIMVFSFKTLIHIYGCFLRFLDFLFYVISLWHFSHFRQLLRTLNKHDKYS